MLASKTLKQATVGGTSVRGNVGAAAGTSIGVASRRRSVTFATFALALFAVLVSMALCQPAVAYANVTLDAPMTVSDDITHVDVNKLDADTHEYVSGATLAIVREDTGEVVDSWVTGAASHSCDKMLDADVVYILREVEAPEGYDKIDDVRFMVNAVEGKGVEILSQGADSELTELYKINLYDKATPIEREVPYTETENRTTVVAPKTGDETPLGTVAALVVAGLVAIVLLQIPKRSL